MKPVLTFLLALLVVISTSSGLTLRAGEPEAENFVYMGVTSMVTGLCATSSGERKGSCRDLNRKASV
jgi:hypothetical protein